MPFVKGNPGGGNARKVIRNPIVTITDLEDAQDGEDIEFNQLVDWAISLPSWNGPANKQAETEDYAGT